MRARTVVIIPARLAATRLPGKPLLEISGKPMIQRVYERAICAQLVERVIVATPDQEIADAVNAFGGTAVITSADHRSGTDRLAEVAVDIDEDIVVNLQGDEPLIEPLAIDSLIQVFHRDEGIEMASLMRRITQEEALNPDLVKVVTDLHGFALYFSRAPIPYIRNQEPATSQSRRPSPPVYGHIGLYAYRRELLLRLAQLPPTPLEIAESLEQLRALENGYRIFMVETRSISTGVDTMEDLTRVRQLIERKT